MLLTVRNLLISSLLFTASLPAFAWNLGYQSHLDAFGDTAASYNGVIGGRTAGVMDIFNRESPYLLSAPHGGFDLRTEDVAATFCAHIPWDCIIAKGYRTRQIPINVNRPSEGIQLPADQELRTPRAQKVYKYYRSRVWEIKAIPLTLYVELHNNSRSATTGHLEVATAGIDAERARRIKAVLTDELAAAHLNELVALIEPIDRITMKATANKSFGIISELDVPTLHLEFPTSVMKEKPEAIAAMLIAALPRIAAHELPDRQR